MLFGWLILLAAWSASAKVLLTTDQALKLAFTKGDVERKTVFISDAQVRGIEKKSNVKMPGKIVIYYQGRANGKTLGYAFFDTHTVHSMPETAMIVVNPDGTVRQVELLAFSDSPEFQPQEKWLAEFKGKPLNDSLWVKRGIDSMTGASLTSWALTGAVRKTLATFQVAVSGAGVKP